MNFMEVAEKIKEDVDLRDYAVNYMEPIKTKGLSHKYFCPFHDDKDNPNLAVYDKAYKCFSGKCGKKGDIFDLVGYFENLSFTESVKTVARRIGYEIDFKNDTDDKWVKLKLSASEYADIGLRIKEMRLLANDDVKKHDEVLKQACLGYWTKIRKVHSSIQDPKFKEACLLLNKKYIEYHDRGKLQ